MIIGQRKLGNTLKMKDLTSMQWKGYVFLSLFTLRLSSGRRHSLFLPKLTSSSLALRECSQYGMTTNQIWGNETKQFFTNTHYFLHLFPSL